MLKLKKWLLSLLVMAVMAVPVMAGNNDAKTANDNAANATSAEATPAAPSPILTSTAGDANVSSSSADPNSSPQAAGKPMAPPPPPAAPAVVPALVPVRVFPIDPPKTGGLSGIKVGPLTLAPYGFIKATVVHDSSDPDGDDFPFPGIWLNAGTNSTFNTGPTKDPEVHVKARATRFGLNLEWPDISKNLTLTGKIEGDFEGNFSEVDNRDVSSIRSNMPSNCDWRTCAWITPPATARTSILKADRIGRSSDRPPYPTSSKPHSWALTMATSMSVLPR